MIKPLHMTLLNQSAVFTAEDLYQDANEKKGTEKVMKLELVYQSKSNTHLISNPSESQRKQLKPYSGAYGLCFGLDNRYYRATPPPPEEVTITITNILYTKGKSGKDEAPIEDTMEKKAEEIFQSSVRNLYRADDSNSANQLLDKEAYLTSSVLQQQLKSIKKALDGLESLFSMAVLQRRREINMRSYTESTFTRIWATSVAVIVAITFSYIITFFFMRRTIVKRKVI